MRTISGRTRNIKSSGRRMHSDIQGIHLSRRACIRKNKREGGGTVKRLGKEEEKKIIGSVEWKNINHKCIKDTWEYICNELCRPNSFLG